MGDKCSLWNNMIDNDKITIKVIGIICKRTLIYNYQYKCINCKDNV